MTSDLLVIVRSGLNRRIEVGETVDAALVCAAFDMSVSLLFEGDGLQHLEENRLESLLAIGSPDDFHNILACAPAGTAEFKACQHISSEDTLSLLQAHTRIVVA